LAGYIAANAPLSVRACRSMVRTIAVEGRHLSREDAEAMFAGVYASNDAREGLAAFRERRKAVWTGT
jgi:enoyl-CoA hydratase